MEPAPLLTGNHTNRDASFQFQDEITTKVPSAEPPSKNGVKKILIFFITGNPALIEYYRPFLDYLCSQLHEISPRPYETHIHGQSLPGFEIAPDANPYRHLSSKQPNDLEAQIAFTLSALQTATQTLSSTSTPPAEPSVILIGHSVGAYIALELLQRQAARGARVPIAAAIALFPTIVDIASSANGAAFTALTALPFAVPAAAAAARLLAAVLPGAWLAAVVRRVTGMERRGAAVTAAWMGAACGVRAALVMAKDEMRVIGADCWGPEVWGMEAEEDCGAVQKPHRLFFYFGAEDPWVSAAARDGIIAARGSRAMESNDARAPVMEVDANGVPHGFCVREEHSRIVAAKVAQYIMDVMRLWEK